MATSIVFLSFSKLHVYFLENFYNVIFNMKKLEKNYLGERRGECSHWWADARFHIETS